MRIARSASSRLGGLWCESAFEAPEGERASRSSREPDSASLCQWRWPARQKVVKPATARHMHLVGLPGCKGTARAKRPAKESGRPSRVGEPGSANRDRESITCSWLCWESEGSIVAKKRVTTVERRDPTEDVPSKRKGVPIGEPYYGTRRVLQAA